MNQRIDIHRHGRWAAALLAALLCLTPLAGAQEAEEESAPLSPEEILSSDLSFDEKVAALNEYLVLNPRNADIYNNLGVLYAEREMWEQAREAFLAAVQSSPMTAAHHKNLGRVLLEQGQTGMAVAEFQAYDRFTPGGAQDAPLLIGDAWKRAGDPGQALAVYDEALAAREGVYDGNVAQMVMRKAMLLDDAGRQGDLEALLESRVEDARSHLAMVGVADPGGRASEAVLKRLQALRVDNARLLSESGLHAQAAEAYEAAMALDESRTDLLPLIADAWLEAGESMKAKVIAQRAVNENPDSPAGWKAKGAIAEKEKRTRDALAAYEKAYALSPDVDVAARIGQLYLFLGDNLQARKFMGSVVTDPDTPPEVIYNYALSLQRGGDHAVAVTPLRKVVARAPEMTAAWRALGMSLRKTGEFGEAAQAYARAHELQPDPKIAFQVGYCASKAGRHSTSIDAYRDAVTADPTYEKAWYNMALVEIRAERWEDALADLQVLEAMEGPTYRIHFNKGICYDALDRADEAIESYESALDVEETSAAWNNLGLVFDRIGDKKEAAECFKIGKELAGEGK